MHKFIAYLLTSASKILQFQFSFFFNSIYFTMPRGEHISLSTILTERNATLHIKVNLLIKMIFFFGKIHSQYLVWPPCASTTAFILFGIDTFSSWMYFWVMALQTLWAIFFSSSISFSFSFDSHFSMVNPCTLRLVAFRSSFSLVYSAYRYFQIYSKGS